MSKISYNTIGKMKREDAIPFFGHTAPKDKITLFTNDAKKYKSKITRTTKDFAGEERLLETTRSVRNAPKQLIDIETQRNQIIDFMKKTESKTAIQLIYAYILERFNKGY